MVVLNDLFDYDLKIYQDNERFKFSLDSLLLAEFTEIKASDNNIMDFCSGNAPVPLILANKYHKSIIGIEIQKEIYELAEKSIKENKLENYIKMYNLNVSDTNNYFPGNNFDIITCNPPFFKVHNSSLINNDLKKAVARHEITITLKEIMQNANYHLRDNGKFYLVHRPERLQEILVEAEKNHLIAKDIKFISSKREDYAIIVLLKFIKNASNGTKISNYIINRDTKTYKDIFRK